MKVSELREHLRHYQDDFGDVEAVLWDKDTSSYFKLNPANIEGQRAEGLMRISIGVNDYSDERAIEPEARPILSTEFFRQQHLGKPYEEKLPALPAGMLYIVARNEREARDYVRAQEDKVGRKVDFRLLSRPEHTGGLCFHSDDTIHLVGYYWEARESEYLLNMISHRGAVERVEVLNWR